MDHIMLPAGRTQRVVCSPMSCVVAHGCSVVFASDVSPQWVPNECIVMGKNLSYTCYYEAKSAFPEKHLPWKCKDRTQNACPFYCQFYGNRNPGVYFLH